MISMLRILILTFCITIALTTIFQTTSASTIYVPNDYKKIQWAVKNASVGDTIVVRDGVYYESIFINKRLTIKSENGYTKTTINGVKSNTILIAADGVRIEGFTITGAGCGIKIESSNNIILNNKVSSNDWCGIQVFRSSNNTIAYNNISLNGMHGIWLLESTNNKISNNNISKNGDGILLEDSSNNIIYLNNFIFIDNYDNIRSSLSTNLWNSPKKITYTYNDKSYTNYLGNYWDDYKDLDHNLDGIGDKIYRTNSEADRYPLIRPWENYFR